jgi:hypothetical protein
MSYQYSEGSRLLKPHKYMYTVFEGKALLVAYQKDRMAMILRVKSFDQSIKSENFILNDASINFLKKAFQSSSAELNKQFGLLISDKTEAGATDIIVLNDLARQIEEASINVHLNTIELLRSLIAMELLGQHQNIVKEWIDLLVQRFEVSKKIYETYQPGFRKGEGSSTSVELYWLFDLLLCLFYVNTSHLKYLSTLLKISDLLCSLEDEQLSGFLTSDCMAAVLASEIISIKDIAERKQIYDIN